MSQELSVRFEMRASPGWIEEIDRWRATQMPIPSRAEAIRRLAERGTREGQIPEILRCAECNSPFELD